jgi:hypothetical protein
MKEAREFIRFKSTSGKMMAVGRNPCHNLKTWQMGDQLQITGPLILPQWDRRGLYNKGEYKPESSRPEPFHLRTPARAQKKKKTAVPA